VPSARLPNSPAPWRPAPLGGHLPNERKIMVNPSTICKSEIIHVPMLCISSEVIR
jgi:hypothetical protein